jgi:hypothetical protein
LSTLAAVTLVAAGFLLHDLRLIRQLETEAQRREKEALKRAASQLPAEIFKREAGVLLDPHHEAWRWFHALRLSERRDEARKALECSVLLPKTGGSPAVEANRQLWLGILAAESGDDSDTHFCAAEMFAQEAERPELILAAQTYRRVNVDIPDDLPAEARALIEYHRGHAALLRGEIKQARACWNRSVDLSMTPIECKCAKAELARLDR